MYDITSPLITDAGLNALGGGYAKVLDTHAAKVAVYGAIVLGGCWLAFRVWEELRNGTVKKHEVLHRGELAPTFFGALTKK